MCEECEPTVPVSSRLVHLSDHFVVSVPYSQSSPYGMTVAPRRHCAHFHDITPEEIEDLGFVLALLAQAIYKGLDDPSYNLFIRSAPCDPHLRLRGEEVSSEQVNRACHWILEFRPRFQADMGGFEIASGIRVVSGLPEDHAAELRSWVQERLDAGVQPITTKTEDAVERRELMRQASKTSIRPGSRQRAGSKISFRGLPCRQVSVDSSISKATQDSLFALLTRVNQMSPNSAQTTSEHDSEALRSAGNDISGRPGDGDADVWQRAVSA